MEDLFDYSRVLLKGRNGDCNWRNRKGYFDKNSSFDKLDSAQTINYIKEWRAKRRKERRDLQRNKEAKRLEQ